MADNDDAPLSPETLRDKLIDIARYFDGDGSTDADAVDMAYYAHSAADLLMEQSERLKRLEVAANRGPVRGTIAK